MLIKYFDSQPLDHFRNCDELVAKMKFIRHWNVNNFNKQQQSSHF